MADKTLAEKMKLKPGFHAAVVNAPSGYLEQLSAPRDAKISTRLEAGPFSTGCRSSSDPRPNWRRWLQN